MTQTIPLQVAAPTPNATTLGSPIDTPDGWITSVIVGGSPKRGRYYCQVILLSSAQISGSKTLAILWEGYPNPGVSSIPNLHVERGMGVALQVFAGTNAAAGDTLTATVVLEPDSTRVKGGAFIFYEPAFSGSGETFKIAITTPVAGANPAAQAIPAGVRRSWKGFSGQLVTAVAAANRFVSAIVTDGTDDVAGTTINQAHTASLTLNYWGSIGASGTGALVGASVAEAIGVPQGQFPPGHEFEIEAQNLQGADQWNPNPNSTNIALEVEEWAGLTA